ncbi:hypothetical protein SB748_20110 [Rhizobium sp. SIMBA_035]|jgi:hypothetical protein|uniref:hypothetical protein n=1 Tax=Rhizobium sp. RAF36 TaxID=3233055 RepID=UPI000DD72D28
MRKTFAAASLLAIGLAAPAFAQSAPAYDTTAPDAPRYSSDMSVDNNGTHPVRVEPVDPVTTESIGEPRGVLDCPNMPQQGVVDSRAGQGGASISDRCREYDN